MKRKNKARNCLVFQHFMFIREKHGSTNHSSDEGFEVIIGSRLASPNVGKLAQI
jgi:hypothetical protein